TTNFAQMEEVLDAIRNLTANKLGLEATAIEKIPQSGSDRMYFRVYTDPTTYIATYGKNIAENRTFIYFSRHFRARGCPVPVILAVNEEETIYLQEDFGDDSLLKK